MRNGEWEMANGIMKWEIENRKLIFFFNFSLRFIVNSEEQMFFIHIHVLFLKHLRAKFKERNKLIIRKKVSLDRQCSRTNIREYVHVKQRLLCFMQFKYFAMRVKNGYKQLTVFCVQCDKQIHSLSVKYHFFRCRSSIYLFHSSDFAFEPF